MLTSLDKGSHEANVAAKAAYVADLKTRPVAEATAAANEQHYEVRPRGRGGERVRDGRRDSAPP